MRNIFKKRENLFPQEYPELLAFVDAINKSYWLHSKWDFQADVSEYNFNLTYKEREIVRKTLLAIAQIEVKVKTFWGDLYKHFPKPEINSVGASMAESEVRHERAYSSLLEKLKLEGDFEKLLDVPEVAGRLEYLNKYLKYSGSANPIQYTSALILFTLFIENSSLFGQFSIFKIINKERNVLKDIDNVIIDTTKEENIHSLLGATLIKIIKEENPDWFTDELNDWVIESAKKAFEAESKIVDWIFSEGEEDYLKKSTIKNYIKHRLNISLEMVEIEPIFQVDDNELSKLDFFEVEQNVTIHVDFFHKKNPNYNKQSRIIDTNELF